MLETIQNTWLTVYGVISEAVISAFPWINVILMVMAACLGSLLCGKIKSAVKDALLRAVGLLTILMGASQLWNNFFVLQTGQFETTGTFLVVISLLVGYAFGHAFALDRAIGRFGVWLFRRFVKETPKQKIIRVEGTIQIQPAPEPKPDKLPSAEGFLLATVICAFGSPTIRGTLDSQMTQDALPLLATIGFHVLIFFLLTALYSANVALAAFPVLAVEGILILAGNLCGGLLTHTIVSQFGLIGSVILIATGLGLGLGKRFRTAKLLPAYLIPVIYGLVMLLVDQIIEAV